MNLPQKVYKINNPFSDYQGLISQKDLDLAKFLTKSGT